MSALESVVRTFTYILPGRFEDAEFASEGLYAALNLIGIYYDVILAKKYPDLINTKSQSSFNKYTYWMLSQSSSVSKSAYINAIIKSTEIISEMAIRKYFGEEKRKDFIILVEILKFALRLIQLSGNGQRMLLYQSVPERSVELQNLEFNQQDAQNKVSDLLPVGNVDKYLAEKALDSANRKPKDFVKQLSKEQILGEILYWLRPVIYSILLKKYGTDSWKPWLISFAIELLAYSLSNKNVSRLILNYPQIIQVLSAITMTSKIVPNLTSNDLRQPLKMRWTELEKDELKRRGWVFLFYLLRNPLFKVFTKDQLQSICDTKIPLISLFTNILGEYIPLWEKIYFYTAAS